MRKLVIITGVLALAACGGEAEVAEEEAVVEEAVEVAAVVGTYNGTTDEGEEWSATINEDGTTSVTVDGEVVETGTWRSADDGTTCFITDTAEGEEPDEEDCYTFGEVGEDGSVTVTGADGESDTVTKVS
ncbi:hypothetical protein OZN62_02555 [Aurantiacibacter sp. MUD11]|uniref:hypothetical protein n=1 Tax=Aurantiacibacter sp. MUD11 TaxID=3003265 RepID=UPI0022AA1116|nr:hypothetical protein [Aurantiacibacter sp. MUD11]WAT18481.1 hypothetical protein OZN62_02555 [Aurantiacibacter sp. MUD11]